MNLKEELAPKDCSEQPSNSNQKDFFMDDQSDQFDDEESSGFSEKITSIVKLPPLTEVLTPSQLNIL